MPNRISTATGKARIFVVEDEVIVARDIRQQLVNLGYETVGHAISAEDCLARLPVDLPDLVLMDIQLAGAMDGISAARIIRTQFSIPVVFLTAYAADDVLARAKLSEPYGYILKPFSDRELRTVLEMALYKSRAERLLAQDSRELKMMAKRVIEVQEVERRRLALELHDELGQSLTAIKINLATRKLLSTDQIEAFDRKTGEIIDDAILKVRNLALSLRPGMLDDLGLMAAIEWMSQQRSQSGGVKVQFSSNLEHQRLPTEIETTFFRVAQEAVTNVQRHSGALNASLKLTRADGQLRLVITDDGRGFDADHVANRTATGQSLGLVGMRERATLIGASLTFENLAGNGTRLTLVCPFSAMPTTA
jgi:signal transduction histidine kinase